MVVELHAIFKGRVQGVGFRWTIVDKAEELQIVGTVRNLNNGSVEMVAQGEKETLEALLNAIKQDSGAARVDSIDLNYKKPEKIFPNFKIV